MDDYSFYKKIFWEILYFIPDEIRVKYDFSYNRILKHLIMDTETLLHKSTHKQIYSANIKLDVHYKIEFFKRTFANHFRTFNYKLNYPEKDIELNRELRKLKIKRILK
jgi:hypothetical protein